MLWDTAGRLQKCCFNKIIKLIKKMIFSGQEEFDAITKAYYRGAQACVLTFSTTDRMSFEAVKEWKMKVSFRFHYYVCQ